MTLYGILKLSPRKWAVVSVDNGTSVLNGCDVENCGNAHIIYGPTTNHAEASNALIQMTRKRK